MHKIFYKTVRDYGNNKPSFVIFLPKVNKRPTVLPHSVKFRLSFILTLLFLPYSNVS